MLQNFSPTFLWKFSLSQVYKPNVIIYGLKIQAIMSKSILHFYTYIFILWQKNWKNRPFDLFSVIWHGIAPVWLYSIWHPIVAKLTLLDPKRLNLRLFRIKLPPSSTQNNTNTGARRQLPDQYCIVLAAVYSIERQLAENTVWRGSWQKNTVL